MIDAHTCPLCRHTKCDPYYRDKHRAYFQCSECQLVFVPTGYHLSPELEKAEYDKHENQLEEPGYLTFLSRMYEPIHRAVKPGSSGLDFGCGPAPALANKLNQLGHKVNTYDLFYRPETSVLQHKYDFITCTEVIEHLASPVVQFEQMLEMLKPGGLLGIMTKLVIDKERFASWHYKNDQTHISFFSRTTFEFLAHRFKLDLEFVGQDVMLFTKGQ